MERVPGDTHHFTFSEVDLFILLGAIVLAFLLLGIVELLARNARTRAGRIVGLVCVLLLVAGLPVWGPIFCLLLVGMGPNPYDFWSVAPWLLSVSAHHFGGIFVIGSVLCAIVYFMSPGGHREKWMRMQMCMTLLIVGMIIYAALVFTSSGSSAFRR